MLDTRSDKKAYAGKTGRTVRRDVERLVGMDLVERVEGGYRAKTETLLRLLPMRTRDDGESPLIA